MVRNDFGCVIADLGFATRISGCRVFHNGYEENAEETSLTDVSAKRGLSYLLSRFSFTKGVISHCHLTGNESLQ